MNSWKWIITSLGHEILAGTSDQMVFTFPVHKCLKSDTTSYASTPAMSINNKITEAKLSTFTTRKVEHYFVNWAAIRTKCPHPGCRLLRKGAGSGSPPPTIWAYGCHPGKISVLYIVNPAFWWTAAQAHSGCSSASLFTGCWLQKESNISLPHWHSKSKCPHNWTICTVYCVVVCVTLICS
jgi:hypothetical protein